MSRRNNGTIIAGSILILFGLLALLGQLFRGYDFWGSLWPFFIVGIGILFFVGMFLGGKSMAGLAIPGSILSVLGLMMLVQNLTGYWESWSYGWTVILFSVGLGIFIMGIYTGNDGSRRSGVRVMGIGLAMFVIFGSFFEMIFSIGRPHGLSQWIFPLALIVLGIYLVLARSGLLSARSRDALEQTDNPSNEQGQ